jgi:hypothetical protein
MRCFGSVLWCLGGMRHDGQGGETPKLGKGMENDAEILNKDSVVCAGRGPRSACQVQTGAELLLL